MTMALAVLALVCGLPASPPPSGAEQEFRAFEHDLIAALRAGDRPTLERLMADPFTFIHSTGALEAKKAYLDNVVSAAQAGRQPAMERLEDHLEIYDGHTAVLTARAMIRRGGEAVPHRTTNVYVKRGAQWQWVSGHSCRLPIRPPATATLTPAQRDAYAGRYEIGPGRVLTVTVQGEALKASLPPFPEAEL